MTSEKMKFYEDFKLFREKAFKYKDVTEVHFSTVGVHIAFIDSSSPTSRFTLAHLVFELKGQFPRARFFCREKVIK